MIDLHLSFIGFSTLIPEGLDQFVISLRVNECPFPPAFVVLFLILFCFVDLGYSNWSKIKSQSFFFKFTFLLVSFMPTWYNLQWFEKSKSELKKIFHKISLYANLWGILLIKDWCGRVQTTVDGSAPG